MRIISLDYLISFISTKIINEHKRIPQSSVSQYHSIATRHNYNVHSDMLILLKNISKIMCPERIKIQKNGHPRYCIIVAQYCQRIVRQYSCFTSIEKHHSFHVSILQTKFHLLSPNIINTKTTSTPNAMDIFKLYLIDV